MQFKSELSVVSFKTWPKWDATIVWIKCEPFETNVNKIKYEKYSNWNRFYWSGFSSVAFVFWGGNFALPQSHSSQTLSFENNNVAFT